MILSHANAISARVHGTEYDDQAENLTDQLRAIEQNRNLQRLVCYLLQKNEELRMRIWQSDL
jgi:predicted DNA binding CopG/RHH family protein